MTALRVAILAVLATAWLWAVAGCATTPDVVTFDRCNTGRVIDACSPADLPPLVAILPPWPFPSLVEVAPEPPPVNLDTPGGRLLQKVAH